MIPEKNSIDYDGPLHESDNRLVEKILDCAKELKYCQSHYSASEIGDQQYEILCNFWRWMIADYFPKLKE